MSNRDIHLRFDNEQQANELLLECGVWRSVNVAADGYLTDVIGLIQKETGEMELDEAGFEMLKTVVIDGWHVNMRGEVPAKIKPYVIEVKTPLRVWD